MGEPVIRYEDISFTPLRICKHPVIAIRLWLRGYRFRKITPKEQEEELEILKQIAGQYRK